MAYNYIEFDCPRQIGKTTWALHALSENPDAIMVVATPTHQKMARRMAEIIDKTIIPRIHWYWPQMFKGQSHSMVIIDADEECLPQDEVNAVILPTVASKNGLVVRILTSEWKDRILRERCKASAPEELVAASSSGELEPRRCPCGEKSMDGGTLCKPCYYSADEALYGPRNELSDDEILDSLFPGSPYIDEYVVFGISLGKYNPKQNWSAVWANASAAPWNETLRFSFGWFFMPAIMIASKILRRKIKI